MDVLYKQGLAALNSAQLEPILDQMIQISVDTWTGFGIPAGPTTYAFGPQVSGTILPSAKGLAHFYGSMTYIGK